MKNHEVVELADRMQHHATQIKDLKGAKFGYCIIKNTESLGREAKAVVDTKKPISDDFKKYDAERIVICEKYAEKEENGEMKKKMIGQGKYEYVIDMTNSDFKKEIDDLQIKYVDTLTTQNANDQDYYNFLGTENTTFIPYTISIDEVPNDISIEILSVIKCFIQE